MIRNLCKNIRYPKILKYGFPVYPWYLYLYNFMIHNYELALLIVTPYITKLETDAFVSFIIDHEKGYEQMMFVLYIIIGMQAGLFILNNILKISLKYLQLKLDIIAYDYINKNVFKIPHEWYENVNNDVEDEIDMFDTQDSSLANYCFSECRDLFSATHSVPLEIYTNIVKLIVPISIIIQADKWLIISAVILVLINLFVNFMTQKKIKYYMKIMKQKMSVLFTTLVSSFSRRSEMLTFKNIDGEAKYFKKTWESVKFTDLQMFWFTFKWDLLKELATNSYEVCQYIIFMYLITQGISLGSIQMFQQYIDITMESIMYFANLPTKFAQLYGNTVHARKLINASKHFKSKNNIFHADEMQLINLSVQRQQKQLSDLVNLKLEFGQKYYIKGKNGVGKSTLIDTIYGLIPSFSGRIVLPHHAKVSGTFQRHNFPFLQTYSEVVAYGSEIQEDKIQMFFDKLQIPFNPNDIMKKFPSGGEAFKLSIARALYKNPNILVIDEGFDTLDEENFEIIENFINDYQKEHEPNLITIQITHRPEINENVIYLKSIHKKRKNIIFDMNQLELLNDISLKIE